MALRNVGMWQFSKCSPYTYQMLRLIDPNNTNFLNNNNTSPHAVTLGYRLVIEGSTLMISIDIEGIFFLVPFSLWLSAPGPYEWLVWVILSVVMRPSRSMRSILSLPGLSMVWCRSLVAVSELMPRWIKISFCPSTVYTSTSSWRGAEAGDILGDDALTIIITWPDVSFVGL